MEYVSSWDKFMCGIVLFWFCILVSIILYNLFERACEKLLDRKYKNRNLSNLEPCPTYDGYKFHYYGLGGTGCPACMGKDEAELERPVFFGKRKG